MGGFGTWMCLNESPARFAAATPICGGAKTEWAEKLVRTPIWVFHGDRDTVVVPAFSERMVDAVRKVGGKKIFLTLYEGEGHDSWTRTYDNQMLYDWMFQQLLEKVGNVGGVMFFQGNPVDGATIKFRQNEGTEVKEKFITEHNVFEQSPSAKA